MEESAVFRFARDTVREAVGASTEGDAGVAIVSRIDRLLEQARESFEQAGAPIACRPGCSFCCHLRVMVLPHEAIALFRHLQSGMPEPLAETVSARLLAGEESRKTGCAFLVEGLCSAYAVRPAACASFHSLSRAQCEINHERGPAAAEGTPVLQSLQFIATEMEAGVTRALAEAGLGADRVELRTAVATLLRATISG